MAPEAYRLLVKGLTTWKPEHMESKVDRWIPIEDEFSYTATSYQEALDQFNSSFLKMGWGDGLPLLPPTRKRVNSLLEGTSLYPSTVINTWGSSNAEFMVEKIAIVSEMAGARPEHMMERP